MKKLLLMLWLVCGAVPAVVSAAPEAGPVLSAADYAIVIPDDAAPQERNAALELSILLRQITGETLAVTLESHLDKPRAIYIGKCRRSEKLTAIDYARLGTDGIRIFARNGDLVLTGGKRGVLYAMYIFLQDYAGCRWFAEDCTVIPEQKNFRIPAIDVEYVPPLEYRDTDYMCAQDVRFSVANQLNGRYMDKNPAEWGGALTYNGFVHTFLNLVPLERYAKDHPEYYAERDGKRLLTPRTQLCLTNPDVLKIVINAVKKRLREKPESIVSVSQNDFTTFCTCKNCMALAKHEDSNAGPLIHFVNAVARAVKDEFPDRAIDTLAYTYTRKAPKHVKADPNVIIRLCTIECCFAHTLEDDPFNRTFRDDLKAWGDCCKRLHIWDYVINYRHIALPFPNFHTIKPNIRFFLRHNVTGIYEEANYFCRGGEFEHLRSYIVAKCLWDPDFDVDKGIVEFTDAYYGAAAPYVRDYIRMMTDRVTAEPSRHMRIYDNPEKHFNDQKLMDDALACFDRGAEAIAGDPVRLARLEAAKLPVLYTRLKLQMDRGEDRAAMLDEFERIARRHDRFRLSEWGGHLDKWLTNMRKTK